MHFYLINMTIQNISSRSLSIDLLDFGHLLQFLIDYSQLNCQIFVANSLFNLKLPLQLTRAGNGTNIVTNFIYSDTNKANLHTLD